ncbi:MAG TPA: hypothetical protein VK611_01150 [Acidimicrobiales bacterium]|nr:hypothetical protein [Acidimicrobiales bacterium]
MPDYAPPPTQAMPGFPPPTEAMPGFGPTGPPPPPGPPGPYGPPPSGPYGPAPFPGPPPGRKSSTTLLVVALLVILAIGGIAFAVSQDGDDEEGTGGVAAGETPETEVGLPSDDGDVPSGDEVDLPDVPDVPDEPDVPPETQPEPTPPPVEEAQAAVHDCIAVDTAGYMTGAGSCSDGGTPYLVAEVVEGTGTCSDPEASFTPSGGYLLCLEVNLVLNHCYVFPEGASGGVDGWITAADACEAPGSVHVIDIVPGVDTGDYCTDDYEWNHWYGFYAPDMVACVMKY